MDAGQSVFLNPHLNFDSLAPLVSSRGVGFICRLKEAVAGSDLVGSPILVDGKRFDCVGVESEGPNPVEDPTVVVFQPGQTVHIFCAAQHAA
jgi:hypothetical protein